MRAADVVTQAKIWKGKSETIDAGVGDDLSVIIPRGKYDLMEAEAEIDHQLEAPVSAGEKIGRPRDSV